MSHDLTLSAKQILKHYTKRWPIETFFCETKQHLGLAKYQVRTLKGIKRLILMIQFVYLYLKRMTKDKGCIGESLRECQRKQKQEFVKLIYIKAQTGVELNTIFEKLKIA